MDLYIAEWCLNRVERGWGILERVERADTCRCVERGDVGRVGK